MSEKPLNAASEKGQNEPKSTRRGFVKKVSYVTPFILSLKVKPAHASNGSGSPGGGGGCEPSGQGRGHRKRRGRGHSRRRGHGHSWFH